MEKLTFKEAVNSTKTSANALAGYLTNQIRQIEYLSGWRTNRELRHWHRQFSEARTLLTTRPPERVDKYTVELADDDNATWLEVVGAR